MSTPIYFPPPPQYPSSLPGSDSSSRGARVFADEARREKRRPTIDVRSSSSEDKKQPIFKPWTLETLSLSGAALMIAGVFVFLSQYDDRPSPNWPYYITINTVVSIFTTVLKALMLMAVAECISQLKWVWFESARALVDLDTFDQASRGGPWAAGKLLWKLQARHLAALGAFVTIITVGIDPFAQQSVQYYQCKRPSGANATATIPVSRFYEGFTGSDITSFLDNGLIGALFDGAMTPNGNNSAISASCLTGNCDYNATYQSLGVCAQCTNLASQVDMTFTTVEQIVSVVSNGKTFACPVDFLSLNMSYPGAEYALASANGSQYYLTMPMAFQKLDAMALTSGIGPLFWDLQDPISWESTTNGSTIGARYIGAAGIPLFYKGILGVSHAETCDDKWLNGGPLTNNSCISPSTLYSRMQPSLSSEKPFTIYNASLGSVQCDPRLIESVLTTTGLSEPIPSSIGFGKTVYKFPGVASWPNVLPVGCSASICAKSFQSTVQSGVLNETLKSEDPLFMFSYKESDPKGVRVDNGSIVGTGAAVGFIPSPCVRNGTAYPLSSILNLTAITASKVPLNSVKSSLDFILSNTLNKTLFDDCLNTIDMNAMNTLVGSLGRLLESVGIAAPPSIYGPNPNRNIVIEPWQNSSSIDWDGQYWLSSMANGGKPTLESIEGVWENIARSVTNHMRVTDLKNSKIIGQSWDTDSCVRVVWPWLTLPLTLVVLSIAFLAGTIFQTHQTYHRGRIVWKSSQLPLLFTGLEPHLRDSVHSDNLKVMQTRGKEVKVAMSEALDGWKLVDADRKKQRMETFSSRDTTECMERPAPAGHGGYTPVEQRGEGPRWV